MKYLIRIAARARDKLTLYEIAHAIAHDVATAGGTPFHKPAYQGVLQDQARRLLRDAQTGKLRVCDSTGAEVKVSALVDWFTAPHRNDAFLQETGLRRNGELSALLALYTKAVWAQEWAKDHGDEIEVVADGEWIDERGVVRPIVGGTAPGRRPAANDGAEASVPPSADVPSGQATSIQARESDQVRQDRRLDRLIALGGRCNPDRKWRIDGGCLSQISQEEKDAGRTPVDRKEISKDIKAAAKRRHQPEQLPTWGNKLR